MKAGPRPSKLEVYTVPRLLIIDEIGCLPIDRVGTNLSFQLNSRRQERGSMISPAIRASAAATEN